MSDQADTLAVRLAPYRAAPGMRAALLISRDGFVVAADAEPEFRAADVAAQAAGAIDLGIRLAGELRQPAARYISLEFEGLNVLLAPFDSELMLVLAEVHQLPHRRSGARVDQLATLVRLQPRLAGEAVVAAVEARQAGGGPLGLLEQVDELLLFGNQVVNAGSFAVEERDDNPLQLMGRQNNGKAFKLVVLQRLPHSAAEVVENL